MTNGFDEALMKNPFDWELRRIYADYLEDRGEEAKAAFQRFAAEVEVDPVYVSRCGAFLLFPRGRTWKTRLPDLEVRALEHSTKMVHRDAARVDNAHAALRDLEDAFVKLYFTGWRPTILPREQT